MKGLKLNHDKVWVRGLGLNHEVDKLKSDSGSSQVCEQESGSDILDQIGSGFKARFGFSWNRFTQTL